MQPFHCPFPFLLFPRLIKSEDGKQGLTNDGEEQLYTYK